MSIIEWLLSQDQVLLLLFERLFPSHLPTLKEALQSSTGASPTNQRRDQQQSAAAAASSAALHSDSESDLDYELAQPEDVEEFDDNEDEFAIAAAS